MYKYFLYSTVISLLLFCVQCNDPPLESSTGNTYSIGDILADEHLELEFSYCYPICGPFAPDDCIDYTEDTFSFSGHSEKVFMIEMSATWWAPCYADIPEGDAIYEHWAHEDRLEIIHFLYDIGQPYTCTQWGHQGELFIPPIIDIGDDLSPFRGLFPNNPAGGSKYPLTIFIDHNMQIISIQFKPSEEEINTIIQSMLNNME